MNDLAGARGTRQVADSIIYLLPVVVGNVILLVTLPLLMRVLTKEDFGVLALAQAYGLFTTGLANFGLLLGYERNFFQYRDARASAALLYSSLAFVLTALLVLVGLTWLLKAPFARWLIGSSSHGVLLFWATCASGMMSLKAYYLTFYKNTGNARAYVLYTLDENVLAAVLSLILVLRFGAGVAGVLWAQLASSAVVLAALALRFLRRMSPAFRYDILLESLRLSVPLTPRLFLSIIGTQFDKYLIRLLGSIGAVGVYSIGQKLAYVGFQYITALQNVFAPRVYERMFALGRQGSGQIGRYLTTFAYASVAGPLVLALAADHILRALTPPPFHGAAAVVVVLSIYYATLFFGKVNATQLVYMQQTRITSLVSFVAIVATVSLSILFIPRWGAIGAAWGTTVGGVLSGGLAFWMSQRYYPIHWETRKLVLIFGTLVGSAVALLVLSALDVGEPMRTGIKVLALSLYLLVGLRYVIAPEHTASVKVPAVASLLNFLRAWSRQR